MMKKLLKKNWTILSCFLLLLFSIQLNAQNGTQCYKPLVGTGKTVQTVQGGILCLNCSFVSDPQNVIDADQNNFASFNTAIGVVAGNGLSVADTINTYPAGWHAGYIVDLGMSSLLTADIINAFTVSTYNNGVLVESRNAGNGLLTATVAGVAEGRIYLSFPTTAAFDEVRFTINNTISGLSTFRVFYALAFDPNCGTAENNGTCGDQIAGITTHVNFSGGPANAITTIANPQFIIDGDKKTFATITIPAAVGFVGNEPNVGVLDERFIYPAGGRAGFVIGYTASILSADIINSLRIQTYLRGQLQQDVSLANGNGVNFGAITTFQDIDLKNVSIATTLPYNEIRLVFAQVNGINLGAIRVYYAYEEAASCTECYDILNTNTPAIATGTLVTGSPWTNDLGTACIDVFNPTGPQGVQNAANVVSPSLTDFASIIAPTLGVGCGGQITVRNTGATENVDTFRRGTYVGFLTENVGGLLNLGLLNNITISVYNGTTLVEEMSGASLLAAGIVTNADGKNNLGFKPSTGFNRVRIRLQNALGVGVLGGELRVYYAFVIRDTDGDGIPDCKEVCGPGVDDTIDTDGDGIPDGCDPGMSTIINAKVLLQGSLTGTSGLLMRDDLRAGGIIPTTQPYNASVSPRFTQVGGGGSEVTTAAVLANTTIVTDRITDWVLVEFRNALDSATVVRTLSGLVERDGDIRDQNDGQILVPLATGKYFISVKHRNHLGVMSATADITAGAINTIDFTTLTDAQVYNRVGGDGKERVAINGTKALYGGDANSDGRVFYTDPGNDRSAILSKLGGVASASIFTYNNADVDMNARTFFTDPGNDRIWILTFPLLGNITAILFEQLP